MMKKIIILMCSLNLNTLKKMKVKPDAIVLIKSTIPIGFSDSVNSKFKGMSGLFFSRILREGYGVEDNLYPSRIIIKTNQNWKELSKIFKDLSKNNPKVFYMEKHRSSY